MLSRYWSNISRAGLWCVPLVCCQIYISDCRDYDVARCIYDTINSVGAGAVIGFGASLLVFAALGVTRLLKRRKANGQA